MESKDIVDAFYEVKKVYNFKFDLKNEQIDVIRDLLNGNNVFAMLPTGFGKSMGFVLPPLMLDEVSLINPF